MLGHFTDSPVSETEKRMETLLLHFHCHCSLHECGVSPFLCNNDAAQRACELLGAMPNTAISLEEVTRVLTCAERNAARGMDGSSKVPHQSTIQRLTKQHTFQLTDTVLSPPSACTPVLQESEHDRSLEGPPPLSFWKSSKHAKVS